ncbi:hypothetical protein [Actinomyces oris]|uniref:hypothetical protein n=1 Tax=Actinomyces oris TaxID=544580 RepID=UPI000AD7E471|nr:hypothetical protein [Actinomyces oris]
MTTQIKTNARDEHPAVLEAVPTTALDGQAGNGAIAIFYGAALYPFELARQRDLVEDYADATDLNLVTEFHDRHKRQDGLKMLLDACQRGGVEYVITAGWPTPNLTTSEADAVVDQLAQAGTHLVCLNAWQPGDGTPPAWWNDEEGVWMRQLDALREEDRRQCEQASETGADSQVNQAGRTGNASEPTETSKEVHYA